MTLAKSFVILGALVTMAIPSQAGEYVTTMTARITQTNDLGKVVSSPFTGKDFAAICQEAAYGHVKDWILLYETAFEELEVRNVHGDATVCDYFHFVEAGQPVSSANGKQRRRLMNMLKYDGTTVGTALFVENFTFKDGVQTGYSLHATFQMFLPPQQNLNADQRSLPTGGQDLKVDRPTVITGKFRASRVMHYK